MATHTSADRAASPATPDEPVVITDARLARSDDIEMRQRRYAYTMLIRTVCFVAMFFVPGLWRWVCLAGASVLPAIAVILANARENRTHPQDLNPSDEEPEVAMPMLAPGPVIKGTVVGDDG
ncbi:DUF3099 domain-containing protein [Luteococcus sp. H138]|uniref:DUF3099 domain-containing protein n=1 Tax=unclassified Luteococcus TaxID=2639923 RepID=UPI00313C8E48